MLSGQPLKSKAAQLLFARDSVDLAYEPCLAEESKTTESEGRPRLASGASKDVLTRLHERTDVPLVGAASSRYSPGLKADYDPKHAQLDRLRGQNGGTIPKIRFQLQPRQRKEGI